MPSNLRPDHSVAAPTSRTESWTAVVLLTFAACALGYALQINLGRYDPHALMLITITIVAAALAIALWPVAAIERAGFGAFLAVAGAGLALQVAQHASTLPGVYLILVGLDIRPFYMLLSLATVVAASGLSAQPWLPRLRLPLLIVLYLLMGTWVIRNAPRPDIDVWHVQQEACRGFLAGENPHAMRFRDPYGEKNPYLPKELSEGGWLKMGYPYPPLTMLLTAPGYGLFGDIRYATLLAGAAAAALIATTRPGPRATLAAALFLLTPRGLQVIEDAWTEPLALMLLVAIVFAASRGKRWMPIALGLFFAFKQYTPIFLPATLLLLPQGPSRWRRAARMYGLAALVVLAVTLPFALRDVGAFVWSVLKVQSMGPYRPDSLSFFPMFTKTGPVPIVPSLLLLVAAYALIWWRAPRTPAGFAAAVGFIAVGFFSLSKQAFLNYYYFAVGAFLCALAVAQVAAPAPAPARQDDAPMPRAVPE